MARALAIVLLTGLALGQMPSPVAALERLFTVRPAQAEWFTTSFLEQVPVALVDQVISALEAQLGQYLEVHAEDYGFVVSFEKGEVPAVIVLDPEGRIAQLRFLTPSSPVCESGAGAGCLPRVAREGKPVGAS